MAVGKGCAKRPQSTPDSKPESHCSLRFMPDPRELLLCSGNGAWRSLVARVFWERSLRQVKIQLQPQSHLFTSHLRATAGEEGLINS